ncbi:MAG: ABC transporter permease [Limisphaerales bacterium]|tara:strand:- start:8572 stop:9405 length:834 start_codon:yes stop_codon:yes gene_type:complete
MPKETRIPPFIQTGWKRYLSIYGALCQNSIMRDMQFKVNFVLWLIVELLWFGLQITFISVIYSHTDHIGSWSRYEVIFLIGAANFIQQLFHAVFLNNITQLSEHIRTGRLDFMLLLPVNPRFLVSLRTMDLGSYVSTLAAIAVMVYAGIQLELQPGIIHFVGFAMMSVCGVMIHYSLMLILASISFWTIKAEGFAWGYYNLFNVARLPDAAFKGGFKAFFTFAIPMLLVANIPTKFFIQKLQSPMEIFSLIMMAGVCLLASEIMWRFAIKHYTSASS